MTEDKNNRLIRLIQKHGGSITARDLQRASRRYPTGQEARRALEGLVAAGFGKITLRVPPGGGHTVEVFCLNPTMVAVDRPEQVVVTKPEPPSVEVRELRKLESNNAWLADQLKLEKKKRAQADEDLSNLRRSLDAATAAYAFSSPQTLEAKRDLISKGSATGIICATDWHCEGKVDPNLVDGVNKFDLDIAATRIRRFWEKSIYMSKFVRNISNINEHILWVGGDMINGAIHEELEESNFLGPTEAVLFIQDQLAAGIDLLLKELNTPLLVTTNQGNHGRSTKKKRISTGYLHSWEYLAYCNLARIYKNNPRVSFKIAQGYLNYVVTQDHTLRFHHGDAIRFQGGVGGITIPARKKIAQWNKQRRADLDIFGHFHSFVDMWDLVSIGCLCGYNEYAMELACDFQPPTQGFIVIDKRYGKVLAAPIFVEKK